MKIKRLKSWEAFDKEVQGLLRDKRNAEMQDAIYPLIFRGQADSSWKLETSLERIMKAPFSVSEYYYMIKEIRNQLETFTSKKWDVPDWDKWMEENDNTIVTSSLNEESIPALEYMTYLRHHGYPSPMLDWTTSPYVAAYFAFRDFGGQAKSVAVYSYIQSQVEHGYYIISKDPKIVMLEHNAHYNKRHYLQQSTYTVCIKNDDEYVFENHEKALSKDEESGLTKYIIPARERAKALRLLQTYNINAYSLFGSEESLLESLFTNAYNENEERKEAQELREKHYR